jgi:hypothetical protein
VCNVGGQQLTPKCLWYFRWTSDENTKVQHSHYFVVLFFFQLAVRHAGENTKIRCHRIFLACAPRSESTTKSSICRIFIFWSGAPWSEKMTWHLSATIPNRYKVISGIGISFAFTLSMILIQQSKTSNKSISESHIYVSKYFGLSRDLL